MISTHSGWWLQARALARAIGAWLWWGALAMAACSLMVGPALAQQNAGDKEVGIGGDAFFTHSSNFTGQAFVQFSLGYFASKRNYFGFEADPTFQFSHQSGGGNSVNVGGFMSGTYRRFIGRDTGRIFPFVGVGGGAYLSGGSSGNSGQGLLYGEVGLKDYVSQRTSLDARTASTTYLPAPGASPRKP